MESEAETKTSKSIASDAADTVEVSKETVEKTTVDVTVEDCPDSSDADTADIQVIEKDEDVAKPELTATVEEKIQIVEQDEETESEEEIEEEVIEEVSIESPKETTPSEKKIVVDSGKSVSTTDKIETQNQELKQKIEPKEPSDATAQSASVAQTENDIAPQPTPAAPQVLTNQDKTTPVVKLDSVDYDNEELQVTKEQGETTAVKAKEQGIPSPAGNTETISANLKIKEVALEKPPQHIPEQPKQMKQDDLRNTLQEIILDIDSNIKDQENINLLKQKELELLRRQQELAQEIRQQQMLAQQLAAENRIQQQQLEQETQRKQQTYQNLPYRPQQQQNVSKFSTFEESKDENSYTSKKTLYESQESSNEVSKRIDLHKIFTPATDATEIVPKNRKLYASSAFYSPMLHPTVEDQIQLARRISHSLSDISNHTSKGQSMYVNRKKRSAKWVHEGCGQDFHQYQPKPPPSPSILPAYSDAGKHRVQLNMHQEQLIEKYAKPGLKVIKTPWEAALETGSASTAFLEEDKHLPPSSPSIHPYVPHSVLTSTHETDSRIDSYERPTQEQIPRGIKPSTNAYQRDLAYKPNLAQGWKASNITLPSELFVPKEIPLDSYTPRVTSNYENTSTKSTTNAGRTHYGQMYMSPPKTTTSEFPSSKSISPSYVSPTPPWNAENHQTVPQSSIHTVSHVNFNPSPLPYDKLAKFENKNTNNIYSSPQTNLAVHAPQVRNTSPAPFSPASSAVRAGVSLNYSPGYERNLTPSQQNLYSPHGNERISTPDLLEFQNFNNAARGWHGNAAPRNVGMTKPRQRFISPNRPQANPIPIAAGSLPYTDF